MLARVTSQESGSDSKVCNVWLLWKWDVHFSEIDSEPLQERYAHCTVVKLELRDYVIYEQLLTAKNSETIWADVSKYTHERSAACFHIFIVFFLYFFFLDKQARRDQLTSSSFPYSSLTIIEIKNRDNNSCMAGHQKIS